MDRQILLTYFLQCGQDFSLRSKVSPQVTTVDTTTVTRRHHIISEVISQLISGYLSAYQ